MDNLDYGLSPKKRTRQEKWDRYTERLAWAFGGFVACFLMVVLIDIVKRG